MVKLTTPPSENIEDRGSTDYYRANGQLSPAFIDVSNKQVEYQNQLRQSAIQADVAETGMTEEEAAELYRKSGPKRQAVGDLGWIPPQTSNTGAKSDMVPAQLLSTEEPPSEEGKFDLSFADPRADIPEKRLKQRAAKAAIALKEDPVQIEKEMADQEGEAGVRQRAVYKDQQDFRQAKQEYLDEILKTRDPNTPMTLDEANFIMGLSQDDFTPDNPSALEKLYAQNVTNRLLGATPVAEKVLQTNPEGYHNIQDAVEQNVEKFEIMLKKVEDAGRDYDQMSWGNYLWNLTEQFIPAKSDWNKYDNELSQWLPGSNVTEKISKLWLLPPKEFKTKVDELYDTIAAYNPLDARDMMEHILSYSRMSEGLANAFFGLDVATTLPIGWVFKGGKAVKVGAEAAEKSDNFIRAPKGKIDTTFSLTDEGEVRTNWSASTHTYKSDGELLLDGWDVGEVDFPEEFRAAQAGKQIQQALMKEELRFEEVLPETGHQAEGIDVHLNKIIANADQIPDVRDPSEFVNLSNRLDSFYNPRAWLNGGTRLTREGVDRILNRVNQARLKFTEAVANPAQAVRLTVEAMEQAVQQAKSRMREEFRFANDGVIDHMWVVRTQDDNPETQLNELIMTMGTPDGLAFREYDHAVQTADHTYKLRKGDYDIAQVGSEYYIQVKRPLDERDPSVTSAMVTTNNETPKTIANTLLGWWRNPDDLLSKFSRENRKIVTSMGQNLQHYFSQAAKDIGSLTNKQKERLSRMMEINRDWVEGDKRGKWFDSVAEYEQEYYQAFKQWPTEAETQAYMLTREISDFDWAVRSLTILRDKSRQGIVNIHTKVPVQRQTPAAGEADELARLADDGGPAGDVEFPQVTLEDVSFEGKLVDGLPEWKQGDYDASVYVAREGEAGELKYLSDLDKDEIQKLINDEGYKVYQTSNPAEGIFDKSDVNFVLLKNAQTSALRAEDMLPYRAGYHVEYAPGFYTKQGQFFRDRKGRRTYGGDRSLIYHISEAAARKYTQAFDRARILLKEGKTEQLRSLLVAELPHSYEQFVRMFSDGTLDVDVPIMYTKSGQSTRDSARAGQGSFELYDTARDAYNSPYNLSTFVNRQFAQEKDLALPSVARGSEGQPLHNFVPAKMIDPLASLSRAMHNMVRMRVYDNYQYQALTSFVEEFANPATLGGSVTKRSLESVRQNPLAFITDPLWNEKAPRDKLAAAKNAHRSIVNLLGVQSEVNRNVDWIVNKVVDSVFDKWGDGAASKAADFLHFNMRDPARYARSIAFHTKLGLGNPVQLFLQAQSVVHGAAITGNLKRSYQAMGAGMFMRYLSLTSNEDIIRSFAKKSRAFGWKEDEFLESFENMKAAGIWHVEGEVADLNDIFSTNMFRGKIGQFLNKGVFFFQEGERFVRLNAWNTAYLEWKRANPLKKIGNRERNEILRRYDDLAINMTRSSTGAWQQGILSIPAQFSTYQIHMMEQMLGKRLTLAEKTRVLATYSALYGIPTGIAAGTAFWPWGQDIKQAAMERGIDVNDGVIDVLLNGIVATGFEAITGRQYAIGERYGPNGLTFFKEALKGEKGLISLMLGPSGQIGSDILTATDPVAKALLSVFKDDNEAYPLMVEDFATVMRNISTVNNAFDMFYAMNAGKFMSKNELFTAKADSIDGIVKGIFGISPREVTDAYVKIESMTEFREAQKEAQKEVVKNYRRALQNFNDPEAFKTYMRATKTWLVLGGFRPDQMEDIIREAVGNDISLIEKVERQWLKYAPVEDMQMRFEQQQRSRQ